MNVPQRALAKALCRHGAPGPTRTGTPSQETDFESVASTNSATGACVVERDYSRKDSAVNRFAVAIPALFLLWLRMLK